MEGRCNNWTSKIFGTQLDEFTVDDFSNTGEGDTLDRLALYNSFYDEEIYSICAEIEKSFTQLQPSPLRESIAGERVKKEGTSRDCNDGIKQTTNKEQLLSSLQQESIIGVRVKRELDPEDYNNDIVKIRRKELATTSPKSDLITRTNCNKTLILDESNLQKHNLKQNIAVTESIYNKKVLTYKINTENGPSSTLVTKTPDAFVKSINDIVLYLIKMTIQQHSIFYVGFILHVELNRTVQSFETMKSMFVEGDNLDNFLSQLHDTICKIIAVIELKTNYLGIKFIEMAVVTALQKVTTSSKQVSIETGETSNN